MRIGRFDAAVTLLVVLAGPSSTVALADNGHCLSIRTSNLDERNLLDAARRLAKPRRAASETLTFCDHRSLSGRWDSATVETVHKKQSDGSETWLLVTCHRRHGKSGWPCQGNEKRGIRVSNHLVEMGDTEPSFSIEASLARDLVERAFHIAANPPADLKPCMSTDGEPDPPQAFAQWWKLGDGLSVWTNGDRSWSVVRRGGAHLRFQGGEQTALTPVCWNPEDVLVVE